VIVLSLAITLEGTSTSGFSGVLIYTFILLIVALPAIGILFGAQTLIPLVVMGTWDEIAVTFKTGWELVGGLILVAGALAYLRARSRWLGTAALLISALLALRLANAAADMYWRATPGK